MRILVDAQISPHFAPWLNRTFSVEAESCGHIGMLSATDKELFMFARERGGVVITKDEDFIGLHDQYGSPPKIIWLTCGNTSNSKLKSIFIDKFAAVVRLLEEHDLVEITDG